MPPKHKDKDKEFDPSSSNPQSSKTNKSPNKSKSKPKTKSSGSKTKEKSLSKKELKELWKSQRQKSYVAPVKPRRTRRDPLEGLAYVLPGELVLVLRSLGKKAIKTREKALDELMNAWISPTITEDQVLVDMLPVWLFYLPELSLHPSRQLRLGAANILRELVRREVVLEALRSILLNASPNPETTYVLPTWALAAHDLDPAVANVGKETWDVFATLTNTTIHLAIASFSHRAIIDPAGTWDEVYPPSSIIPSSHPATTPSTPVGTRTGTPTSKTTGKGGKGPVPTKGSQKGKAPTGAVKGGRLSTPIPIPTAADSSSDPNAESESLSLETLQDRHARLRVNALGALGWVVSQFFSDGAPASDISTAGSDGEAFLEILSDTRIWGCLASPPIYTTFSDKDVGTGEGVSPGTGQPLVRKAAWRLVGVVTGVLSASKASITPELEPLLHTLSTSILVNEGGNVWQELDKSVQSVMWKPLVGFLREHPDAWTVPHPVPSHTLHRPQSQSQLSPSGLEGDSDSDSDSSSDEEEDTEEEGHQFKSHALSGISDTYPASTAFLTYLRSTSPTYPEYAVVLVLLGTIPVEVLLSPAPASTTRVGLRETEGDGARRRNLESLFDALWEPWRSSSDVGRLDNRDRERMDALPAFIQAVLECMVFLVRRISAFTLGLNNSSIFVEGGVNELAADGHKDGKWLDLIDLVNSQIKEVWELVLASVSTSASVSSLSGSFSPTSPSSEKVSSRIRGPGTRVVVPRPKPQPKSGAASDVLANGLGDVLKGLRGGPKGQETYYNAAFETIARFVKDGVRAASHEVSLPGEGMLVKVLKAVTGASEEPIQSKSGSSEDERGGQRGAEAQLLLKEVFDIVLDACEQELREGQCVEGALILLDELLCTFAFRLNNGDGENVQRKRIDALFVRNAYNLLLQTSTSSASSEVSIRGGDIGIKLLATYLHFCDDKSTSQATMLWYALLEQIIQTVASPTPNSHEVQVISRLLDLLSLVQGETKLKLISPAEETDQGPSEIDEMILGIARQALSLTPPASLTSSSSMVPILRKILLLSHPSPLFHPLLTPLGLTHLVQLIVQRFGECVGGIIGLGTGIGSGSSEISHFSDDRDEDEGKRNQDKNPEEDSNLLDHLDGMLLLVEVLLNLQLDLDLPLSDTKFTASTIILPCVFLLAHVLPRLPLTEANGGLNDGKEQAIRNIKCTGVCSKARRIWDSSLTSSSSLSESLKNYVYSTILGTLRDLLRGSAQVRDQCASEDIVDAFDVLRGSTISASTLQLLPDQTHLGELLDSLSGVPISRSLGVLMEDGFDLAGVPPSFSFYQPNSQTKPGYHPDTDATEYIRYTFALLRIVSDDLGLAKGILLDGKSHLESQVWIIRHLLALCVYAEGVAMVPAPSSSYPYRAVFDALSNDPRRCKETVARIQQIVGYVFSSAEASSTTGWTRKDVCSTLLNVKSNKGSVSALTLISTHPIPTLLINLLTSATQNDSYRDCYIFREVFTRVLNLGLGGGESGIGLDEDEANLWLKYARTLLEGPTKAPLTGITILSTLIASSSSSTSSTFSSSAFSALTHYRNTLASSLLAVPSVKASSDGVRILSTLVLGTAPDAVESDVEFLPVQRAVNVVRACQKWVEEQDEDENVNDNDEEDEAGMEELESIMTLTFFHLAPILQNVPGGHWQFIFDVMENNIESCDIKFIPTSSSAPSPPQLLTLARTLRLITHIHDLAATNKALRAEWSERRDRIMRGVKELLVFTDGVESELMPSIPESACRELALELLANYLPDELIDYETLPKMCHLLSGSENTYCFAASSSIHHPQVAYQILQRAAKKRTEYFVMEAAVDTEGKVEARLPNELMTLLQREVNLDLDLDLEGVGAQNVFVYLLGWMLFFDLFVDTSVKVRMSYIDQLRSAGIIENHFIPTVLALLSLDSGIVKAFKLDMWAIDEFYVQFYEPGSFSGPRTLAAHLYYRALLTVPSLIHSWVLDCRDRQLSSTIATYTSAYLSPVLIRAELEHVKKSTEGQSVLASSADDEKQLTVKVASGVVNEVTALYSVDEQQLEIRLRIPSDWPLHRIEIRDTRKVGVDDNRWRAWILGVQQTIWAQNGRIVDGLALFKKNVTGHFAGQVECAICYSIISVMDGTLPKKPCNTCKNRFHAGCLYKWFNSSHSSSCPLCRSDILH